MNVAVQVGAGQIAVLFLLAAVAFGMLFVQQNRIEKALKSLKQGESTVAVTLQQLDAAIAAETTENATLLSTVTQLDTDVTALIAQIQAGADFTNELNAVQANLATITGVVSAAAAEDTSVQGQITPPPAAKPSA